MAFLKQQNIPFERARDARHQASDSHNREQTPNIAKSIERRALRQTLAAAATAATATAR